MVIAFIILAGLILYLLISIVMYHIMFLDLIPFHVAHKYYCETDGGFTVFKALDEWKRESPGVVETLIPKIKWITRQMEIRKYICLIIGMHWKLSQPSIFFAYAKEMGK